MSCELIKLGCFPNCEVINTGIIAAIDGEYIIKLYFDSGIRILKKILTTGDELIIDESINENYTYHMTVIDPDGSESFYSFNTKILI